MSRHHSVRTGADHPNTGTSRPRPSKTPPLQIWHLHVGTIKLYIVGPGPDAFLAVSDSYYKGQVGTDAERNLARKAVRLLSYRHRDDTEAGPAEIAQAIADARAGIRPQPVVPQPVIPKPQPEPQPEPQPKPASRKTTPAREVRPTRRHRHGEDADPLHIASIVRATCESFKIPVSHIKEHIRTDNVVIARHIVIHLIAEAYPDLRLDIIGAVVARSENNVSAVLRGSGNVKSIPNYNAIVQGIRAAIANAAA